MKTIKGLRNKPGLLEEEPGINSTIPIFRLLFKNMIGKSLAKSGDDSIDRYQVGMKLMQDQDDIELEDAEFLLLKDAVETNQSQLAAHYHAQMMMKLKDAEKLWEKLKKEKDDDKKAKADKG